MAIIGTFAVMAALGFSLNNLTLFGLVLAIGIVVDDAIVVVEAVEHHIEAGLQTARSHDQGDGTGLRAGDRRGAGPHGRVLPLCLHHGHRRPVLPTVRLDDRHLDGDLGIQFLDPEPGALRLALAASSEGGVPGLAQGGLHRHRLLGRCDAAGPLRDALGRDQPDGEATLGPDFRPSRHGRRTGGRRPDRLDLEWSAQPADGVVVLPVQPGIRRGDRPLRAGGQRALASQPGGPGDLRWSPCSDLLRIHAHTHGLHTVSRQRLLAGQRSASGLLVRWSGPRR